MIFFRRALVVLLAGLFVLLFIPALVTWRVNTTLGNPDYYINQLRQANAYNFLYDEVMPAAIETVKISDAPGTDLAWLKPYLPPLAKQTVPPEWLQARTEEGFSVVLPYVLGDTDGFALTIDIKGRVQAGAQAVKDTLHKKEVFDRLYPQLITAVSEQLSTALKQSPVPVDRSAIEGLVRQVLPSEWLLKQIDSAIDEVVPYLTADKEHFALKVDLVERLDAVEAALNEFLARPEVYDLLMKSFTSKVAGQIFPGGQLPGGLTLTADEYAAVAKQLIPYDSYRTQVPGIVSQIVSYLKGNQSDFQIALKLTGKAAAIPALSQFLDSKLEAQYNALPVCTSAQMATLLPSLSSGLLPECRPPGITYAQLKAMTGLNVSGLLTPFIQALPEQVQLSASTLLGQGASNPLIVGREMLQKGLVYTDASLQASLGAGFSNIQTARQLMANGASFTQKELRQAISGGNSKALADFDQVRSTIGLVRHLLWVVWLVLVLLLVAVGFLGGRRWSSRLVWASAVLVVSGAIALLAFGPIFTTLAEPGLSSAFSQVPPDKLAALVVGKGVLIARSTIDSFIGGLRIQAVIVLVVGIVGAVGGIVWRLRRPEAE